MSAKAPESPASASGVGAFLEEPALEASQRDSGDPAKQPPSAEIEPSQRRSDGNRELVVGGLQKKTGSATEPDAQAQGAAEKERTSEKAIEICRPQCKRSVSGFSAVVLRQRGQCKPFAASSDCSEGLSGRASEHVLVRVWPGALAPQHRELAQRPLGLQGVQCSAEGH